VPEMHPASASTVSATALLVALFACAQSDAAEPAVKKSRQGICHERGSVSYTQTIYFDPFPSMDECLKSDGRLARAISPALPEDRSIKWYQRFSRDDADKFAAFAVVGAVVIFWHAKWKSRRKFREFAARERRQWEGHRRE
jgi:hypothetical protein